VDSRNSIDRRLRQGLLDAKRSAVIALRDTNQIDDIVLREVESVLDWEEMRLLGPSPRE
jgi:CPA1 family monovalent cation:H+ antiporter